MLFLSQASMANWAKKVATIRTPTVHHMHRMTSCRGSVTLGASNDAPSPALTGISPSPHEIRQPACQTILDIGKREPGRLLPIMHRSMPEASWFDTRRKLRVRGRVH